MTSKKAKLISLLAAGTLLAGCAGYRGGWQSVAYLGETPPAGLEAEASSGNLHRLPAMRHAGLELNVRINNELRTYDTQVYFFVLPLSVDPRDVYTKNHEPGKTRVYVTVTPRTPGYVFRPGAASLRFANQQFAGAQGFEFGMWDEKWNRLDKGGKWEHRPVGAEFALAEIGRKYYLSIDFPTPVPTPQSRDIMLDLSKALSAPAESPLPPIRFTPVRWKDGYT